MGKEKKEIWKLLELLNEYGYKKENYKWRTLEYRPSFYFIEEQEVYYCSKKFWFIKWLVENDKIDFEWKLNTIRFESLVDQIVI